MAFGMALGSGVTIPEKLAEGRHSAAYLCARARFEEIEMPVCEAVDKIVNHKANIKTTIAKLLSRQAGSE
jgi:glycerol-3-phosphate dehydrogenase (NAD(P)+)